MRDPLEALSELPQRGWLVGGALRDRLLNRHTADYDVAIDGDPERAARSFARSNRAHAFALSEGFGAWRVVPRDRTWQVDFLPVGEGAIEADLAQRDLTINALAEPLGGGELIDPFEGLRDLRDQRLRMVSPDTFARDPLRALRLVRLACELEFSIETQTARTAKKSAGAVREVAPERVFAELKRIVSADRALEGLELMDELSLTEAVLPELGGLRGVQQSAYHHLDVHQHTRAVLAETIALERDPEPALGSHAAAVGDFLARPLANELTRWQALRFAALLHDVAKPQTRAVSPEGRVTFIGHDAAGAEIAREALERLRASDRLCEHVAALVRHHLRLGFLVHEMPLDRRTIYRYLRACEPVQVDVTVLSVADRLATRGSGSSEAIDRHLELARQLLGEALSWLANPPRPPVRGDELARALGIAPGPGLGRLLGELEEASFAGEINSPEDALERARQLVLAHR